MRCSGDSGCPAAHNFSRAAVSVGVLPSFNHLPPSGHGRVLFLSIHATGLWRNVETLQDRAPHQPKPPCNHHLRPQCAFILWKKSFLFSPRGKVRELKALSAPFPSSCGDSPHRHLNPHRAHPSQAMSNTGLASSNAASFPHERAGGR